MVRKMPLDEIIRNVVEKSQRNFDLKKFNQSMETMDYKDPMYAILQKNKVGNGRGWEEEIVPLTTDRPIFE
jgi:hypothetical protein